MQGEGGDGGIGIRIEPGISSRGILHWEDLDQPQAAFDGPVDEQSEVGELPHPQGIFAAQAEDGDGDPGTMPAGIGLVDEPIVQDTDLIGTGIAGQAAVWASLPTKESFGLFIPDPVFIFDRKVLRRNGQICCPPVAIRREVDGILLVPILRALPLPSRQTVSPSASKGAFTRKTWV